MSRVVLSLCFCLALAASVPAGNRIFGGTEIQIDQVPFAAAFSIVNQLGTTSFHTGGVVITSRHILSAAHSFLPGEADISYARLGSSFWHSGGVNVLVATVFIHPDYNPPLTRDSDITVVVLSEAVLIGGGTGISNAILPAPNTLLPTNMPISVAGWGLTEFGGPSSQLRNIDVFVIDWEICRERTYSTPFSTLMFCAGILDVGGISACHGDSGGPAYSGGVAYGLVSFGQCGSAQLPTVYTNVASFIEWTVNTVNAS